MAAPQKRTQAPGYALRDRGRAHSGTGPRAAAAAPAYSPQSPSRSAQPQSEGNTPRAT